MPLLEIRSLRKCHRVPDAAVLLLVSFICAGLSSPVFAQTAAATTEPGAGGWRTWVLASGKQIRLPPPPDNKATATELQELRALAEHRDATGREQIRYWDFWSPSHRWNEMMTETAVANHMGVPTIRAYMILNVAIADAMVAAWDSKYAYNRRRPNEADARLVATLPTPRSPSYPCEYSVAAVAGSTVLAHLFPKDAARFAAAAEEAARSRVLAGVVYPSDARAGLELGRTVGGRVIEAVKIDGKKWAGIIPVGPGLWQGTDPVGIDEIRWKLFVLSSASQFRPGPPPAPDSPERAAEIGEVKNFKRTPVTNGKAMYWQFGQYGGPGLTHRFGDEIGKRLAEAGLDRNPPRAARAYALVHMAHYESYIAAQDGKYHYWTARPNQFDSSVTTVVPTPNFPTYPSNAAALGMASALVLGHLFPRDAARFQDWATESGESRIYAGIHFRSDIEAGYEIGRKVGGAVVGRAQHDGAE